MISSKSSVYSQQPEGASFWSRLMAVAHKELLHVRRDPVMPRLIILVPIMVLVLFGYALNTSVKNIPLAVLDQSQDRISQVAIGYFASEERFQIVPVTSQAAALQLVQNGQAKGFLWIKAGAMASARKNQPIELSLALDGSDPNLIAQAGVFAREATQDLAKKMLAGRALTDSTVTFPVNVTQEVLYNPEKRTAVYMVPGIIGLVLALITTLLTAVAVVRERELGTMESLIATPVRPLEVVIGKILPYFGFGLLDAALVIGLGVWLFRVPINGSIWLLALASLLFVLGSLGIGVFISTVAKSQMQAIFTTYAFIFPNLFLSGMLFSLDGMLPFFRTLSAIIPLRYYLSITRGVMLRGADLGQLQTEFLALTIFAVVMLLVASSRFRKTL
jgi:ABC-2 type transport system permease protein